MSVSYYLILYVSVHLAWTFSFPVLTLEVAMTTLCVYCVKVSAVAMATTASAVVHVNKRR